MKKEIIVTEELLRHLHPYQGQDNAMPAIGETLSVHEGKKPKVRREGYFVQVTNWKPSVNSLYLIARHEHPDADKYGWKRTARTIEQALKEKKEIAIFQRWSIDYRFVK